MIRKATYNDVEWIEDTYDEHFKHEIEHGHLLYSKKACIRREKMRKKPLMMEHYMYTRKTTKLQEELAKKHKRLTIELFDGVCQRDKSLIKEKAEMLWDDIVSIDIM